MRNAQKMQLEKWAEYKSSLKQACQQPEIFDKTHGIHFMFLNGGRGVKNGVGLGSVKQRHM